jgi:hypothetical protein
MSLENAAKILETLKAAEREPSETALKMLNQLAGLIQSDRDQRLEIEEARSSAFMTICEIGKALHRGQPAGELWVAATNATEKWIALAT